MPRTSLNDTDMVDEDDSFTPPKPSESSRKRKTPEAEASSPSARPHTLFKAKAKGSRSVAALPEAEKDKDGRELKRGKRATTQAKTEMSLAQAHEKKSGSGVARRADFLYPKQERVNTYKRAGMPQSLTDDMLASESPHNRSLGGATMAFDQSLDKPQGLKESGLSRNHVVADSNIAALLYEAHNVITSNAAGMEKDERLQKNPEALRHFIETLGGPDAVKAFEMAVKTKGTESRAYLNEAVKQTSLGMNNLRFDDAKRNTEILHGLDIPFDDRGKITEQGAKNFEALRGLWRYPSLREHAMNAGQQTIDMGKKAYVSSSLSKPRVSMSDPDHYTFKDPVKSILKEV